MRNSSYQNYFSLFFLSLTGLFFEFSTIRTGSSLFYCHTTFLLIGMYFAGTSLGACLVYSGKNLFFLRKRSLLLFLLLFSGFLIPTYIIEISPDLSVLSFSYFFPLTIFILCVSSFYIVLGIHLCIFTINCDSIPKAWIFQGLGGLFGWILFEFFISTGTLSSLFFWCVLFLLPVFPFPKKKMNFFSSLFILGLIYWTSTSLLFNSTFTFQGSEIPLIKTRLNSQARVSFFHSNEFYRALSPKYQTTKFPEQNSCMLDLNSFAPYFSPVPDSAPLLLKETLPAAGFSLIHHPRVLICGSGMGKDIHLSSSFSPEKITGIEVNEILASEFIKISSKYPSHEFIYGEAFEELTKVSKESFDIILLNTVVSFSAGNISRVFSENFLYTREGFDLYLSRLSEKGILSILFHEDSEAQILIKLINTLQSTNYFQDKNLINHLMVLFHPTSAENSYMNLLISPCPFPLTQEKKIETFCQEKEFKVLHSPSIKPEIKLFEDSLTSIDYSPSTLDKPFPFFTLSLKNLVKEPLSTLLEENTGIQFLMFNFLLIPLLGFIQWNITRNSPEINSRLKWSLFFAGFSFLLFETFAIHFSHVLFPHFSGNLSFSLPLILIGCTLGGYFQQNENTLSSKTLTLIKISLILLILPIGILMLYPEWIFSLSLFWKIIILTGICGIIPIGFSRFTSGILQGKPSGQMAGHLNFNAFGALIGSISGISIAIFAGYSFAGLSGVVSGFVAIWLFSSSKGSI